jgi:hypothetical protein
MTAPVDPLCVVPRDGSTSLVGVDVGAIVTLATLPWFWPNANEYHRPLFAIGEGHVAYARYLDAEKRTVLELFNVATGSLRALPVRGVFGVTALAIAAGRVFVAHRSGLFALPLDDPKASLIDYDVAPGGSMFGVDSLVVDGDRLVVLESVDHKSRFSVFDLRNVRDTSPVRRTPLNALRYAAALGGPFVVVRASDGRSDVHTQNVYLHDRESLDLYGHVFRAQNARFNDYDPPPPESPGWPGPAAVLDDTVVVAEATGDVLAMRWDELLGSQHRSVWLPDPARRHTRPFDGGAIDRFIPVPYRRAAVVIVHDAAGASRAHLWEP